MNQSISIFRDFDYWPFAELLAIYRRRRCWVVGELAAFVRWHSFTFPPFQPFAHHHPRLTPNHQNWHLLIAALGFGSSLQFLGWVAAFWACDDHIVIATRWKPVAWSRNISNLVYQPPFPGTNNLKGSEFVDTCQCQWCISNMSLHLRKQSPELHHSSDSTAKLTLSLIETVDKLYGPRVKLNCSSQALLKTSLSGAGTFERHSRLLSLSRTTGALSAAALPPLQQLEVSNRALHPSSQHGTRHWAHPNCLPCLPCKATLDVARFLNPHYIVSQLENLTTLDVVKTIFVNMRGGPKRIVGWLPLIYVSRVFPCRPTIFFRFDMYWNTMIRYLVHQHCNGLEYAHVVQGCRMFVL